MLLKQMIRIRETEKHERVLLAIHRRVAPHMAGRVGLPPSEYRLLSEMSASGGPSVPRSRSVWVVATYVTAWLRAVTLELAPSELRLSDCALTGQSRWSCNYTNYD